MWIELFSCTTRPADFPIGFDDVRSGSARDHLAMVQEEYAAAQALDGIEIVGDEEDGSALDVQLVDSVETLRLKIRISDRQHLIEQEDVGLEVGSNRKAKADVHT